jgi:hypothetical protein
MPTLTQDDVRKLRKATEGDRLEKAWQLALSGLRRDAAFTMRTEVHSQDDALRSAAAVLDVVTSFDIWPWERVPRTVHRPQPCSSEWLPGKESNLRRYS